MVIPRQSLFVNHQLNKTIKQDKLLKENRVEKIKKVVKAEKLEIVGDDEKVEKEIETEENDERLVVVN